MASYTIEVPDSELDGILLAFADAAGVDATAMTNEQLRALALSRIMTFVRSQVVTHQARLAAEAKRAEVDAMPSGVVVTRTDI